MGKNWCLLSPSEADPLKPQCVKSSKWRTVFRCGTTLADGIRKDHDGVYYWAMGFPVHSHVQICNYPGRASPPPMDCKEEIGIPPLRGWPPEAEICQFYRVAPLSLLGSQIFSENINYKCLKHFHSQVPAPNTFRHQKTPGTLCLVSGERWLNQAKWRTQFNHTMLPEHRLGGLICLRSFS